MILLASTADLLQVITGQAVTTIFVHASFVDYNGSTATPQRTNTAITGAATTTVVASPGSSVQRNIKSVSVHNSHASSSCTITVQHTDNTNAVPFIVYTLLAGETIQYFDTLGWQVLDAAGGLKLSPASGRFLRVNIINQGTTSYTTGADCNKIKVRLQAAGGAGGGCTGNATQAAVAGGGSAGGYAEKTFAVTPNTAYTCAVGTGGTGVSNATGNAGGNTTFAVGGTTVTANGGLGGIGAVSQVDTVPHISLGGASPAVSTNGDLNTGGSPGLPGIRPQGTAAIATGSYFSGSGGSSQFGPGANGTGTAGTGNAASVGFGGGGGGALSNTAGAATGGAGANGVIVVEEYA